MIFEILIFYIVADYSYSKWAVTQVAFLVGAIHLFNSISFYTGQLDRYTLTVMVHQAVLVNGPQLIHLSKFQRRSWHRWFYVSNTIVTLIEYVVSLQWSSWINRNGNFCPQLTDAINATQGERANWTIVPLLINIILSSLDVLIAIIDKYRNRHVDRSKGDHSRPTIPRRFLWERKNCDCKRAAYFSIGVVIFFFSVFIVEFPIMWYFHKTIENIEGISSSEDGWGIGQCIAMSIGVMVLLTTLRSYLIKEFRPYARKAKGPLPMQILTDTI